MYKILLTPILLLFIQVATFGQSAWKLVSEKEGIKIYTSEVIDSKIKAIKVECEFNASASQLVALLMDINTSADWVYHTKSATIIKQVSPSEIYYYSEVNMPWPTANRDFVAHLTVSQNPITKVVIIDGPAVQGMMPDKKGIVRISNSIGKWTITPFGLDQIKVQYTLHVEPGGSIPAWMVNMFASQGPQQIFKAIRVQLEKPEYKNAILPFIENRTYAANMRY
jgi:hypothetical protein